MMRRSMLTLAVLLAVWPLASEAQYVRREADRQWVQQQAPQRHYPPRYRDKGQDDDDRRATLTPDERRELNRDLRRADREIYRKDKGKR